MSERGIFVNGGEAYLVIEHISAFIITPTFPGKDKDHRSFGVSASLDNGSLIPVCPAESYEDAKEKLKKWAGLLQFSL